MSAPEVDKQLRAIVAMAQRVETNLVLVFYEMNRRKLYRKLGYATMQQYGIDSLEFSKNKIYRLMRISENLDRLPALHRAVARGKLGWTKAYEITKVASAETVKQWIDIALNCGKRELVEKVIQARRKASAQAKTNPGQPVLSAVTKSGPAGKPGKSKTSGAPGKPDTSGALGASGASDTLDTSATPENLGFFAALAKTPAIDDDLPAAGGPVVSTTRFSRLQLARFEAQLEQIRKLRLVSPSVSKADLMVKMAEFFLEYAGKVNQLESAEAVSAPIPDSASVSASEPVNGSNGSNSKLLPQKLFMPTAPSARTLTRGHDATNYLVILFLCEACGKGWIQTDRGRMQLSPPELGAVMCDTVIQQEGKRNRRTIPPSVRREVLGRDRHTCQAPGCINNRFLEVHHINPRRNGGGNHPDNLITLCSTCHRFFHEHQWRRSGQSGDSTSTA